MTGSVPGGLIAVIREEIFSPSFGVGEAEVRKMMALFSARSDDVEKAVSNSMLSDAAKALYLSLFKDRLRALAQ